jgi:transcriptional regulator with XRE-family HTH domain
VPRRETPDPLAEAIGARIRELRRELGLTQERLAYEAGLNSKGHLSGIERGLVLPGLPTLRLLADRLGVEIFDLLVTPEQDLRSRLVDRSRKASQERLRAALETLETRQRRG